MLVKKFFFLFITLFPLFPSLASSSNEERALSYVRNLTFEVTRYNVTGLSSMSEAAGLSEISKVGSALMAHRKIADSVKNPVYLCEFYNPEKIGIIDSTFCPEDLYVAGDFFAGIEHVEEGEDEELEENLPELDWIDEVFQTLYAPSSNQNLSSETFGILDGEKILQMLENNDSRGIESQAEEGKDEQTDIPKEFSYTKNDGSLRRFSYDGEQFSFSEKDDQTVLVHYYGDKLIRKHFDELYRLVRNERFKTGSTAKSMNLESQIDYTYAGESNLLKKSVEDMISDKRKVENLFDDNGRVISKLESHYEEREIKSKKKKKDGEKAETETVLLDDKKTVRVYDEKGRTIEEDIITWTYKTNSFGRNMTEQHETKNLYDYSAVTEDNNLLPNVQFFENGELHLERTYTDATHYSERMYFEGGFSVEVLYENDMRKTEIIYLNGVESRRREFEY